MAAKRKLHFNEEDVPQFVKDLGELRLCMMEAREQVSKPQEVIPILEYAIEQMIMLLANFVGEIEQNLDDTYEVLCEEIEETINEHEGAWHEEEEEEVAKPSLSSIIG